ncbi:hypothetical protein Taro_044410 [Colocasia esculenta]|uniref:TH1 domain-containing protein n=1 Tax=Colocasia esculenta TaxID=4460 RepID=A0A843WJ30_COLES|nr:hypothetical protein [Colocasia esculenta]
MRTNAMDRYRAPRRVHVNPTIQAVEAQGDDHETPPARGGGSPAGGDGDGSAGKQSPSSNGVTGDPEKSAGDHIGVKSYPYLMKLLSKQGDKKILFADKVLKFTESGKMKRRILLITDFAIYLVDPEADRLKRRIALAAVDKICLSKLRDNFFAIIIPSEYDCLMASTRKKEIVTVLVEATRSTSEYELEVAYSKSFEYNASSELVKEVHFKEADGGVRTKILRKGSD